MQKEAKEEWKVRLKLAVIEIANHFGATKACRELNDPPRGTLWIVSRKTCRRLVSRVLKGD